MHEAYYASHSDARCSTGAGARSARSNFNTNANTVDTATEAEMEVESAQSPSQAAFADESTSPLPASGISGIRRKRLFMPANEVHRLNVTSAAFVRSRTTSRTRLPCKYRSSRSRVLQDRDQVADDDDGEDIGDSIALPSRLSQQRVRERRTSKSILAVNEQSETHDADSGSGAPPYSKAQKDEIARLFYTGDLELRTKSTKSVKRSSKSILSTSWLSNGLRGDAELKKDNDNDQQDDDDDDQQAVARKGSASSKGGAVSKLLAQQEKQNRYMMWVVVLLFVLCLAAIFVAGFRGTRSGAGDRYTDRGNGTGSMSTYYGSQDVSAWPMSNRWKR